MERAGHDTTGSGHAEAAGAEGRAPGGVRHGAPNGIPDRRAGLAGWQGLVLCLGCIAAVFLARWPARSAYLFNWDAANHALATLDYDIINHQPHPPGYPLWVLLTRGLVALGLSANSAQIVLTQLFCGLALAAVWATARRARGDRRDAWAGPLAAAVCLFSPLVLLYSAVAGTYTAELMTSAVTGWFVVRMWDERRLSPALWGCVVWALCAGLRTSGSVFTAPLLLVGLVRACGLHPGRWLACGLAGTAAGLAWLLPVIRSVGSLQNYKLLNDGLFRAPFEAHSVLYGGPAEAHVLMATRVSTWMLFAVALPLAAWVLTRFVNRTRDASSPAPTGRPAWAKAWFFVVWGAPCLAFSLLVFGDIPGYLMAAFPPCAVALGLALARQVKPAEARARLAGPRRLREPPVLGIALLAFAGLLISSHTYDAPRAAQDVPATLGARVAQALDASSLNQVRRSDAVMAAVTGAIRDADVPPGRAAVLVLDVTLTSANFRKLSWHLPELPVAWLSGSRPAIKVARDRHSQDLRSLDVPAEITRLWIVAQQPELPAPLAALFPDAERRQHTQALGLWAVDLSPGPWERELVYGPQRFLLRRQ